MNKKIVINPLTRISGFLEIEAHVNQNTIIDAKSSGMLFRGFENMLVGRPPLDAIYFTERICGICSTAHSMSSALALENALNIVPNENSQMIRDFIHGCEFLQNHLRHFYLYTLPDFVKGPEINPVATQTKGDYRLPPEINEKLSKHYTDSIEYSRLAHKMLATLAGKAPHNHGIFVGGVTINIDASIMIEIKSILESIISFVENVMLEDILTLSQYYEDYFYNGKGFGHFLSFGVFDHYRDKELTYLKPSVMINQKQEVFYPQDITENITHAWYDSDKATQIPLQEDDMPNVYKEGAYSFVKAPRYRGFPMEVGPLARMWLSGDYKRGISTMDRMIARVLETKKISLIMKKMLEYIVPSLSGQKQIEIPDEAIGVGLVDTTRGALGHYIKIKNQIIEKYTIITPTAWNLSPTDAIGVKGVIEKSLMGTMFKNDPVDEIGRIVRSFDPCVSCATHVLGDKKDIEIRVV